MKHLFIMSILTSFLCTGQMLCNTKGQVLEDMPFFNSEFIKAYNIKSFRGSYATKYDHDVIRPNNDTFVYEFDRLGQLVRKYRVLMNDTLASIYLYDYRGNVTMHRESNKFGYYEHRYAYDRRNRVVEMELRRDKKSTLDKFSFELDESHIAASEKYEYTPLQGIDYKKKCYNSAGLVYRVEFYYFNDKDLLAKKESALHNGVGRIEVNYFYDEKNRVQEVKTISKGSGIHIRRKVFSYDKGENVLSRHLYRNDKLISEEQIVYFDDTKLLKAVISREEGNRMLTILQFKQYRKF